MNNSPSILIAVADDDALFVSLLVDYINKQEKYEVIITASDGAELIDKLSKEHTIPEIVLLDLNMKKQDGVKTLRILNKEFPSIKTIVISSYYQPNLISFMLKSGVDGFQPKGILPDQLIKIMNQVLAHGHYFSNEQLNIIRDQLPEKKTNSDKPYLFDLSPRELEIIDLICQQHTAKEIGEKLFITQRTVEGHKNNILLKTGVKNTAGLVIFAIKNKLVDPNSITFSK